MSLTFLNSSNFVILGTRSKTLGINLRGNVLVLFKMAGDANCSQFEPIFVQASQQERRVSFAVLDVNQCKDVVMTSRDTTTPITAVPSLILYINGRPHAKFKGTKNLASVQNFITTALKTTPEAPTQTKQFMAPPQTAQPQNMYGGYQQPQNVHVPDIGKAPSMKSVLKNTGYGMGNNVEEEDEPTLLIPDAVIPWNTPWEAEFQKGEMN
jgi:hypothetical protein